MALCAWHSLCLRMLMSWELTEECCPLLYMCIMDLWAPEWFFSVNSSINSSKHRTKDALNSSWVWQLLFHYCSEKKIACGSWDLPVGWGFPLKFPLSLPGGPWNIKCVIKTIIRGYILFQGILKHLCEQLLLDISCCDVPRC